MEIQCIPHLKFTIGHDAISFQGKLRLQKWYITLPARDKAKIIKDVTRLTLARRPGMCNFLEYKGKLFFVDPQRLADVGFPWTFILQAGRFQSYQLFLDDAVLKILKVIYRRYASLFFICATNEYDNELAVLEIIHRYVELLDSYFGNVGIMTLLATSTWSQDQNAKSQTGLRVGFVSQVSKSFEFNQ